MTEPPADIILLARDEAVRERVHQGLPRVRVHDTPLEALADVATTGARGFVATVAALGYRGAEILRAVRRACPDAPILLLCRPEEEPQARQLKDANDYFILPLGIAEMARALAEVRCRPRGQPSPPPPEMTAGDAATRIGACLAAITAVAGRGPGLIARQAAYALAALVEVSAAAVIEPGGAARVLATSDPTADWSDVAPALATAAQVPGRWVPSSERTWLFAADQSERPGTVLAVRCAAPNGESVLNALVPVAQVALALVTAAREKEAAVRVLSTDAETGLASRRYFDHYLASLCRQAMATHHEVTLALVSPTGDESGTGLRALADVMGDELKAVKLARVDRRTLAAAFAGTAFADAAVRLRRLAERIDEAALPGPVAIGAACLPWQATDAESLLAAARKRLAESRTSGCPDVD